MRTWLKIGRRGRGIALNVIEQTVTHQVNEHIFIPLAIISLGLAKLLSGIRGARADNGD